MDDIFPAPSNTLFSAIKWAEKEHIKTGLHYVIVAGYYSLYTHEEKKLKEENPLAPIIYNTRKKILPEWYIIDGDKSWENYIKGTK